MLTPGGIEISTGVPHATGVGSYTKNREIKWTHEDGYLMFFPA